MLDHSGRMRSRHLPLQWVWPVMLLLVLVPTMRVAAATPVLVVNTGMVVDEDEQTILTNAMLQAADPDTPPNGIFYRLTNTPVNGTVLRNTVALTVGNTFTQADIVDERIAYEHDGSETTQDAFAFIVTDEPGTSNGVSASFAITINPINDPPTLIDIADQTIIENVGTPIHPPKPIALTLYDPDSAPSDLRVSASSLNQELLPDANIRVLGFGAQRALTLRPAPNQVGSTEVIISVSDGVAPPVSDRFVLTVVPLEEAVSGWLALVYVAADDVPPGAVGQESLSERVNTLVSEMAFIPPNLSLHLAVLVDGAQEDDSRLYVRTLGTTALVEFPCVEPSPCSSWYSHELDTGSPATLRNFITWARRTYPGAEKTFLALIDHGGGWAPDLSAPGQPSGGRAQNAGWRGMLLDAQANNGLGTSLATRDLSYALSGQELFDVLFLDACLMGMVEVAVEVAPYADYLIAGENILWSRLPYAEYLSSITSDTSPAELARHIVKSYNNPPLNTEPFTIAAIDLTKLREDSALVAQINQLAEQLLAILPPGTAPPTPQQPTEPGVPLKDAARLAITRAYNAAQKFDYDSTFAIEPTDVYVDLADFARHLAASNDPQITNNIKKAAAAIMDTVGTNGSGIVLELHTNPGAVDGVEWDLSGATGLSIYLPLGEQDERPIGVDADGTPLYDRQLAYYADPGQLAFTRAAPTWAELLLRLELETPPRDPAKPEIRSPFPGNSAWLVNLPIVQH